MILDFRVHQPDKTDESSVLVGIRTHFEPTCYIEGTVVLAEDPFIFEVDDKNVRGPVGVTVAERAERDRLAGENKKIRLNPQERCHEPRDRDGFAS